jgi:hypothetical protein
VGRHAGGTGARPRPDARRGSLRRPPPWLVCPGVIRRLLVWTASLGALALAAPSDGAPAVLKSQVAPDRVDPTVRLFAPRYASDRSRTRRFRVGWKGGDQGSGIARYRLEVRLNASVSTRWRRVRLRSPTSTSSVFRGHPGRAYLFRVRARDRFGNLSRFSYDETVVPIDDRSPRVSRSLGWRRLRRTRAYGHSLSRARGPGHTMRLVFRGTRVAVLGRRFPQGARLLVTIDGRPAVIRLSGRRRYRAVLFRSRLLRTGLHLLRVETLGGGVVDIDGFGIDTGPSTRRR